MNVQTLQDKHRNGQFTITVELDPPKSAASTKTGLEAARLVNKVDAINIADSPMANMRMSPIALAHIIQEDYHIETIFHLTCRDRNLIGLQAELLGAAALGVRNILTLTGDQPERGDHPQAKPVYETDSIGLIRIAASLNNGKDMAGNEVVDPANFYIGTTANPGNPDLQQEIEKLKIKIDAGAGFVQTQPVYDMEVVKRFMEAVAPLGIPILMGLLPLRGIKMATYLDTKVPGISVPPAVMERVAAGGRTAGLAITRELLGELKFIANGAHIMPLNDIDMMLAVLE